ncbi:retrovirus-related pol polyprotein from transposon TNT 1-94 [Tanacetum coccineum]
MTPRSCLRWKPTGKFFKTISLRWVPTGKIFTSSTTKVDSEPTNGSNEDITNQYECEQTLDVSAGTLNLSAGTSFNLKKEALRVWLLKRLISQKPAKGYAQEGGMHKKRVLILRNLLHQSLAWKQFGFSLPTFVDPDHPEKVYRLRKALYGLKQAPRAWYDELLNFLMSKGFTKGLQIHQSPRGIFINQSKYTLEILKKHGMEKCDTVGTLMATKPKLDADLSGKLIDQTDYRSKIGSLMYLTGTINMRLWYPKDSGFELTAFSDADHVGCLNTRKSTFGGIQFLGDKLVSWMSKKQDCTAMSSTEDEYMTLSASCAQVM